MKSVRESRINITGLITTKSRQCFAYSDDIAFLARSKKQLEKTARNPEGETRKAGLIINEERTKYVISPFDLDISY